MALQLKKKLNLVKLLASYATGVDVRFKPVLVDIEPTNRCNLNCAFCPRDELVRPLGRMDPALLREVVDQTADTAMEYHFNLNGEPTLHPKLPSMLSYVAEAGAKPLLYSNFSHKKDSLTDAIAESGVGQIIVNVGGADPGSYRASTGHGDFDLVLHNLRRLDEIRRPMGKKSPHVIVTFVPGGVDAAHAEQAREVFEPLCDYFSVPEMHDWLGVDTVRAAGASSPPKKKSFTRCSRLWTGVTVLWDGRLAACCYDYNGEMIVGDLKVDSVEELWSSPRLHELRRKNFEHPPCNRCNNPDPQFSLGNTLFRLRAAFGR